MEFVELGSPHWDLTPGRDGYIYPLAQQCPPSLPVTVAPHHTAQASVPLARPSQPSACFTAPTALAKLSYRSTTSPSPDICPGWESFLGSQGDELLPYSRPPPPRGGSTTPSARLRTPPDCPPSTESNHKGGRASSWASMPMAQAPDPPSACSVGLMAPLPAPTGVKTPSQSSARSSVPA